MLVTTRFVVALAGLLLLAATSTRSHAGPVGTAFTYQGVVSDGGVPVDGPLDLRFSLWDDAVAGAQTGPTLTQAVTADAGAFAAELDFGVAPFTLDQALWLQVEVSDDGGANYTPLERQRITPAPHSLSTRGITVDAAGSVGIGTGSPLANLHLSSTGPVELLIEADTDNVTETDTAQIMLSQDGGFIRSRLGISANNDLEIMHLDDVTGTGLVLGVNESADLVINQTGDVGIGIAASSLRRLGVSSAATDGTGVFVDLTGTGMTFGVDSGVIDGYGVRGTATGPGTNYGVYGEVTSPTGWSVFSNGRVGATGTKSFVIDHPFDPTEMVLLHYSSESPEPLNTYRGNAILDGAGRATVVLPGYFEAINADYSYQLTPIGAPAPGLYVANEIQGNVFSIAGGVPGQKVSWHVTARRDDAFVQQRGAPVEVRKPPEQRGKYLMPELYGAPASQGIHAPRDISGR